MQKIITVVVLDWELYRGSIFSSVNQYHAG